MKKNNCVISAVGRNSLHRTWKDGECDFDLHLIVYDDSFEEYRTDAEFVCKQKGYKLYLVHQYLSAHPELKERYEYYFLPDDDILMTSQDINDLFAAMRRYRLQIAQPALIMSYRTWEHTLWDRFTRLRYTNFIEMMVPCFSKEALSKVFFTFAENSTGWGAECHWAQLIGTNHRDMAILDEVTVQHTRPIQSGQPLHQDELVAYLKKYNLSMQIFDYGNILHHGDIPEVCDRDTWHRLRRMLEKWVCSDRYSSSRLGSNGWLGYIDFLLSLSKISQVKNYQDLAVESMYMILPLLNSSIGELPFGELAECCRLLEIVRRQVPASTSLSLFCARMGRILLDRLGNMSGDMSVAEVAKVCHYLEIKGGSGNCHLLMELLSKMDKLSQVENMEVGLMLEIALTFKRHGMPYEYLTVWASRAMSKRRFVNVENTYDMYKLYALTDDGHYGMRLREELRNMPSQFMTLRHAIMLSEMLLNNNC